MVGYKKMKESQIFLKKLVKKCWQKAGGVVLYLSAKRWDKRMTSEASARSLWKEPIDVQKHQLTLRCWEWSKFRKFKRFRKKSLTKNRFCGKIIKSSAARLRRTGPWKLNNIEKLVTEPIFVLENTLNNSKQSNSHRTQAIACWAKQDLTLLSDKYHL